MPRARRDGMLEQDILEKVPMPNFSVDYLPPSEPAAQLNQALGTTSIQVDFGRATGQTTSGTPVASLTKPGGSGASLSAVSDTGSVWRVTIQNALDGENYMVTLTFTASDGQKTYRSALAGVLAGTVMVWDEIAEIDFTSCTNKDVSATGSTHQVYKADGTTELIQCIRTFSSTNSATCSYNFVNGTGLVLSQNTAAVDARNGTLGLDLASAGLTLNLHEEAVYIEVLTDTCELEQLAATTGQVMNLSIQDSHTATGEPSFGWRCERDTATTWDDKNRKRFGGTSTNSAGQTGSGVEMPVTNNIAFLLLGGHKCFVMRGISATYQTPSTLPTEYQGTAYGNTTSSVDTYQDNWTGSWLVFSATNQTVLGGNTTMTIKKLKLWKKQPVS